jgi:hypothetical protein
MKRAMVTRVTKTDFELDDGRVYQYPFELDRVPTIEEFQRIYNHWRELFEKELDGEQETNRDSESR